MRIKSDEITLKRLCELGDVKWNRVVLKAFSSIDEFDSGRTFLGNIEIVTDKKKSYYIGDNEEVVHEGEENILDDYRIVCGCNEEEPPHVNDKTEYPYRIVLDDLFFSDFYEGENRISLISRCTLIYWKSSIELSKDCRELMHAGDGIEADHLFTVDGAVLITAPSGKRLLIYSVDVPYTMSIYWADEDIDEYLKEGKEFPVKNYME